MKPMLAHKYEAKRFRQPCYIQAKLNGIRCCYQNGGFWSRDEIKWHDSMLTHILKELQSIDLPTDAPLDGELYVHGWSLQQINSAAAVKRTSPSDRTSQLIFNIFDVADDTQPFINRYWPVRNALKAAGLTHVHAVDTFSCPSVDVGDEHYEYFVRRRYEGAIYRFDSIGYTQPHVNADQENRTWSMLKRKDWHDDEFRIIGVKAGLGKLAGKLGALTCITHSGQTFDVGSGPALDDISRQEMWNNPPIDQNATVKYLYLSDDGIPQNPTLLAIRPIGT